MAKRQKRDAVQEQVDAILEQLAKGVAPWQKPWQTMEGHRNLKTKRAYSGANAMYLSVMCGTYGFSTPLWLTWKQCKAMNCHPKQDQWDNTFAVQWFRPDSKTKLDEEGQPVLDSDGDEVQVTKWYRGTNFVYNVEQTTLHKAKYEKLLPAPKSEDERNTDVEEFITNSRRGMDLTVLYGGDRACYRPTTDVVNVPNMDSFKTTEDFYATTLHELAHATGHKTRLVRGLDNRFGSPAYAEEELVAEMAAAFLGAEFQIDGQCQHVNYLGHWFKAIDEDKTLFHRAAGRARKAAEYISKSSSKGSKEEKKAA